MQSSTVGPWVGKWGGITVDGGYLLGPRSFLVNMYSCRYRSYSTLSTVPVQYLSKLLQNMLLVAMLTLAHIILLSVPADM